jgi:hypothetical protein
VKTFKSKCWLICPVRCSLPGPGLEDKRTSRCVVSPILSPHLHFCPCYHAPFCFLFCLINIANDWGLPTCHSNRLTSIAVLGDLRGRGTGLPTDTKTRASSRLWNRRSISIGSMPSSCILKPSLYYLQCWRQCKWYINNVKEKSLVHVQYRSNFSQILLTHTGWMHGWGTRGYGGLAVVTLSPSEGPSKTWTIRAGTMTHAQPLGR